MFSGEDISKALSKTKFCLQEYKVALPSYFTDQGKPARSWEFQEPLVFKRFDSFVNRLHTMLEFFSTAVQVSYIVDWTSLLEG